MTREDAIKTLKELWRETNDSWYEEVYSMAINALEADRKTEPRKEQNFCGKCRYLYRDFKYGLSCYRLMDNEPCKYEDRKTENSSEKPNNCEECKHWNDTEDDCADRHECRATTEDWQDWKDRMWAEAVVTEPQTE